MKIITIPPGPRFILSRLRDNGHEAYVVGGCVRDAIMNAEPNDWDICTEATPDEVIACFRDLNVIETGLKHGTVTVVLNEEPYEVTTFRTDGTYSDGRHPDDVQFVKSVEEDLCRRDFTINAMAADIDGNIIDPYGGTDDINNRLIRCVGHPRERFGEDALRMLRALRFSARFGFSIADGTARAIHEMKDDLNRISAERIQKEFVGILCAANAYRVLMDYVDVIGVFIPEITVCVDFEQNNPYHCYNVYQHIAVSVDESPRDEVVRLTMFFHDIGKPLSHQRGEDGIDHFHGHASVSADITEKCLTRLRFSNAVIHDVVELVKYHDVTMQPMQRFVLRMLNKMGEEQFRRLLRVREADINAQSMHEYVPRIDKVKNVTTILSRTLQDQAAFKISDLAVNGKDLMEVGIAPGPKMGELLKALLDAVIDGTIENNKTKLLDYAKQIED